MGSLGWASPLLASTLPPGPPTSTFQGELCKAAACVELACMTLGVTVDAALVARWEAASVV